MSVPVYLFIHSNIKLYKKSQPANYKNDNKILQEVLSSKSLSNCLRVHDSLSLLLIQWFSSPENIKDNRQIVNFVIVAIIYVLHQMSAKYKKKHKQHKTWQNYTVQ